MYEIGVVKRGIGGMLFSLAGGAAMAQTPTPTLEDLWALVQAQQQEIASLRQQLERTDSRVAETSDRVEATVEVVEQNLQASRGSGESSWAENTRLGAYAEMHYNNLDNEGSGKDLDELDMHRFVLFASHDFSDRTRFFSEVEIEHSLVEGGEDSGELELEQAFVEHDLGGSHRAKAGLFLLPVGIMNETHEPDTFYGVERNMVESRIIPTTWWEGGLAISGELAPGFAYDLAFTSGLGLDAEEGKWSVRDGRQKVAKADASDPAYTLRLKYTGLAGLELASTLQYQQDIYQGEYDSAVDALLWEAHIAWNRGPFGLRALYADWNIDSDIEALKQGADRQRGWYVEPTWRISDQWGVFGRYSEWDNQAGVGSVLDSKYRQWNIGFNYWLDPRVVFKLDYQWQDAPSGKDQLDGLNLGLGWSF